MDFLDIEDFEGFIWADTLEEAEARWDITAKKQVFILDDFWGSVFHRDSRRKEAEKLENFITRVRENENKRLIITTREYIIRQEMDMSPGLRDVIENFKMECVLKDMSAMEKAKILFSHLENSDLEYEYVQSIFYYCQEIIRHPGYSLRVIEKYLKQERNERYSSKRICQDADLLSGLSGKFLDRNLLGAVPRGKDDRHGGSPSLILRFLSQRT